MKILCFGYRRAALTDWLVLHSIITKLSSSKGITSCEMNINIFVLIANKAFVNFVPQIKRGMSWADKLFSNNENSMSPPPNTHTQNKNKKEKKKKKFLVIYKSKHCVLSFKKFNAAVIPGLTVRQKDWMTHQQHYTSANHCVM